MSETDGTRRLFIGGLTATATVLGSAALLRGTNAGDTSGPGRLSILGGDPPHAGGAEIANGWTAAIGEPVRIAGEQGVSDGRVSAVMPGPDKGKRPANLRQRSFTVFFEFDARTAPLGNRMYDIGRAIDGLSNVFLTRGQDVAGKAILMAVFN